MANVNVIARDSRVVIVRSPEQQAYEILHWGFVLLPVIAGFDKFTNWLANWEVYLAPLISRALGGASHGFMLVVGVIEMTAGFLVAVRPKVGAYVVAGWLAAIVTNLVIAGIYLDVALRDFGLLVGAMALGSLAQNHRKS